jgi:transcriptional regulator with XRE-family HTH domain
MAQRSLKASEVADCAGITRPVMSRYLANRSGISAKNLIKLSQYLNVSPDWLLNGSDAPESIKMSRDVSMDKNKIIALQDKRIEDLEQKVKEWEDWKASSKDRHAKGKAKADLAIAKNKNTLRINTTRKRKK